MDNSVKKFRERRDARLKKRMDDDWITIKGTHVMVDEDRNITAGPERLRNAKSGSKAQTKKDFESKEYDRIPRVFSLGGSKYAKPEEKKARREIISSFMNDVKEGDVYSVGGGVGSSGGSKFKITKSRGKLALQWVGEGYSRPVELNRANVEKYISNGAKLIERNG